MLAVPQQKVLGATCLDLKERAEAQPTLCRKAAASLSRSTKNSRHMQHDVAIVQCYLATLKVMRCSAHDVARTALVKR